MKRKEKLALAQLKTKQLLKEQEFKRKMTELQYEREFMEAQMEEERAAVSLDVYKQAEEENECVDVDNKDIVSMELESSVTQGTELHYLREEPHWRDEKANAVVQPIPFECTPVQVRVPLQQSPTSGKVFRGQKVGPHSAKEAEKLKTPPISSNWPQQVQLPLNQQTKSNEQVPNQIQSTLPVRSSEQVPIQFQSTHPIKHRILDPVKGTYSDGFLGQSSAQPPSSQPIEILPQGTITSSYLCT